MSAAAPDMLEALEGVMDVFGRFWMCDEHTSRSHESDAMEMVERAIGLAKGEDGWWTTREEAAAIAKAKGWDE